jgi:hypothetical protein
MIMNILAKDRSMAQIKRLKLATFRLYYMKVNQVACASQGSKLVWSK